MPRVVSIYRPTWPIDRMMRAMGAAAPDGKKPLVLVGQHGRQGVVTAANAISGGLGLRAGMPASKTQALDRLAVWALRYSPVGGNRPFRRHHPGHCRC
jgi:protein ImuB